MKHSFKRQTYCELIAVKTFPTHEIVEKTCKIDDVDKCITALKTRFETVFVSRTHVGFDDGY